MLETPFNILTINTGSSSLKAALYRIGQSEDVLLQAQVERIGLDSGRLRLTDAGDNVIFDDQAALPDHAAALSSLFKALEQALGYRFDVVGHRVVHGGGVYQWPQSIDHAVISTLKTLVSIDPDHLPQAIAAIEFIASGFPSVPQVACFDTTFHRTMPRVARVYALPQWAEAEGIVRYGFHGLSYEYVLQELRGLDELASRGRVVIAHLGNGASMAAIRNGASVETTMGFSPAGGLVMGTRPGDLDPGVLLHLLESGKATGPLSAEGLNELVNKQAGLLGVSGSSSDVRDLLQKEPDDPRAALALDLFCYQARKFLGAFAAVLGGLETLVFTAGIGEHSAAVRARICDGLEFLGVALDAERNEANAPLISRDGASVAVRIIPTNEDLMIARQTATTLRERKER